MSQRLLRICHLRRILIRQSLTIFMVKPKRYYMSKNDLVKNKPFKVVSLEDELSSMVNNREKFIKKFGQDTYNRLVEKLETDIQRRKQPQSASPS